MDIPDVHPKRTIDLSKFGKEGEITIETPDFRRMTAIQNSAVKYLLTEEEKEESGRIIDQEDRKAYIKKCMEEKVATTQAITVLGYITSAPFHINDYRTNMTLDVDAYYDFVTPNIYNALLKEVTELGLIDPLR